MALQSLIELQRGRKASKDGTPQKRYIRKWQCEMESSDSIDDAMEATGVPAIGDAHPDKATALCQSVVCDPVNTSDENHKNHYIITAEYGTLNVGGPPSEDTIDDPLAKPIEIEWSEEIISQPMEYGYGIYPNEPRNARYPMVNSVGDKFDPVPQRDISQRVLTVTKNQSTFTPLTVDPYKNHVNSTTFSGFPPETVLFVGATARSVYTSASTLYWTVTYTFKYRPETYITELQNVGLYGYDAGGDKVRLRDDADEYLIEPADLDANGVKLPDAEVAAGNVIFVLWYTYPSANLNDLAIGI